MECESHCDESALRRRRIAVMVTLPFAMSGGGGGRIQSQKSLIASSRVAERELRRTRR
jgi:hypothetical protein